LVITNPRPTRERIVDWYPETYYAHVPRARGRIWNFVGELKAYKGGYPTSHGIVRRTLYGGAAALLQDMFLAHLPYMGNGRRLLDVGCGVGSALLWARERGWDTVGVEMDAEAVEVARSSGLQVLEGTVESADLANQYFDAISLSQVLEHTFSPTNVLIRCRHLLRPGGVLLVAVPNFASYFRATMNEAWPSLELPRHLYHFDERTLEKIALKCGLLIDEVRHRSRIVTAWSNIRSLQRYMSTAGSWDKDFSRAKLISKMATNICPAILNPALRISDNMLFTLRRPVGG
jgi:2-polyprenyl-3-methyl-5-hydroxy-6-metoxy-1,4-benzoquinol methylase